MRSCFCRVEPWLQAGKYVGAVCSGLPKRNGWTVARHVGDRTSDRTQRLLNRVPPGYSIGWVDLPFIVTSHGCLVYRG